MQHSLRPTICVVHETFGRQSAIAKVAAWNARVALAAGFRVSIVASELDEEWTERVAQGEVEHRVLKVPPRAFAVKWLAARKMIGEALSGGSWDIVHVHQPQAIGLADVFQCHFLTRKARETGGFARGRSLYAVRSRAQQEIVLQAEDRYFRRPNAHTRFLFCSALLQKEFVRLYGLPPRAQVLVNFAPPYQNLSDEERHEARLKLVGKTDSPVVGYLGGRDERKGYRKVLRAARESGGLNFLIGGPQSEEIVAPELGNLKTLGMVRDLREFYAACDVVVVPSSFDPCPLVSFEAAAYGVPVLATSGVGNLSDLLRHGAGGEWDGRSPLEPKVRELLARRTELRQGAKKLCEDLSETRQGERLLEVYEAIVREKREAGAKTSH